MIVLAASRGAPSTITPPSKTPPSTIRITNMCSTVADQKSKLLATVIQQLFQAQTMIQKYHADLAKASPLLRPPTVDFGKFLMSLADNTRALGKADGILQACTTIPDKTVDVIKSQRNQNYKDLVVTELRLNEAYSAKDFDKWLTLRTKIQMYHSVVAKLDGWLSKIAADQAAAAAEAAKQAADAAQTQLEAEAAARAAEEARLAEIAAQEQGAVTESDAAAVTQQADGFFVAHRKTILWGLGILGGLVVVRGLVK